MRRIEADAHPNTPFVLITVGSQRHSVRAADQDLTDIQSHYWFPFHLSYTKRKDRHKFRESSFRSRAFVYTVMAGTIAHLTDAQRIVLPESGQGIVGPLLTPVGNEAPDVRAHPLFTQRVERFLYAILGKQLAFDHPRLVSVDVPLSVMSAPLVMSRTLTAAVPTRTDTGTYR